MLWSLSAVPPYVDFIQNYFSYQLQDIAGCSHGERESIYSSTENNVTGYFRHAEDRENVSHFGYCSGRDFSLTAQPISKRLTALERPIHSSASFSFYIVKSN